MVLPGAVHPRDAIELSTVRGATPKNSASSGLLAPGRQQSRARSPYSGLQHVECPAAFMFDPFEASIGRGTLSQQYFQSHV
jgi:hypothetical protein